MSRIDTVGWGVYAGYVDLKHLETAVLSYPTQRFPSPDRSQSNPNLSGVGLPIQVRCRGVKNRGGL